MKNGPRTTIKILGSAISCFADTGPLINVVDKATFKSLEIKPALEKCNTRYFAYKADHTLPILRQFVSNRTEMYFEFGPAKLLFLILSRTHINIIINQ